MYHSNHLKSIALTLLQVFLLTAIAAQGPLATKPTVQKSIFSSFYTDDCLEIKLESNFDQLIENKKTIDYQDAWISYATNDGGKVRQLIKIRPRGKSRRTICDIPPVMMNFARGNPNAIDIYGDKKLKLVTHCFKRNTDKGQQNILKEFLAYKLLNLLTEKSFRVQLVRITYVNTSDKEESQRFGFIIEGNREIAKRLAASRTKRYNMPVAQLERDHFNTVAVFQYMINNSDWNLNLLHNVKVFTSESSQKNIVIPYDFDYANFVSTGYAKVNVNHNQKSLDERIFLGAFHDEAALNKTLDLFQSKKEALLSYSEGLEYLTKRNRKYVKSHIKSFYKIIEKRKFAKKELMDHRLE